MSNQAGRVEYLCSPPVIDVSEISLRTIRRPLFSVSTSNYKLFLIPWQGDCEKQR